MSATEFEPESGPRLRGRGGPVARGTRSYSRRPQGGVRGNSRGSGWSGDNPEWQQYPSGDQTGQDKGYRAALEVTGDENGGGINRINDRGAVTDWAGQSEESAEMEVETQLKTPTGVPTGAAESPAVINKDKGDNTAVKTVDQIVKGLVMPSLAECASTMAVTTTTASVRGRSVSQGELYDKNFPPMRNERGRDRSDRQALVADTSQTVFQMFAARPNLKRKQQQLQQQQQQQMQQKHEQRLRSEEQIAHTSARREQFSGERARYRRGERLVRNQARVIPGDARVAQQQEREKNGMSSPIDESSQINTGTVQNVTGGFSPRPHCSYREATDNARVNADNPE